MSTLTPEQARSTLLRLQPQLAPVAYEVVRQIVSLFDISGQTTVAKVLERCYGDKSAAAATKAFERLREAVNEAAQTLGDSIRLEVDSRKSLGAARAVYFWGEPAVAVHAVADELAAVNQAGAMIEQQGRWLIEGPPRVVVLTVSPNEQSGLYEIFSPEAAPKTVEHQGYRYDDFGEIGNYRVLHINCEMGGLNIAIRAMRVIDAWKPILIVALGMAFGVDQKTQKLGDVLIASVVQAYELQRLTSGQPPEMRDSATRCAESWLQQLRLQKGHWRHSAMSMPELHFGKVLSGQKLLADAKKRDKYIRQTGGDAIGGEMEGFGLAEVCSDRRIDWLLIKGIADWGDVDKPKGEAKRRIQHDASLNAAKVLLALLDPNSAAAAFAASDALSHVPCADAKDFRQIEKLIENNARRVGLNADQLNANAPTQDAVNAFEQLTRWVQDPVAPAHFALLGEYGMGKTVLCQRLCEYLTEQRAAGIALPRPLYFDLRRMPARNDERVPSLEDTLEGCVTYGWLSAPGTAKPSVDQLKRWVTEGALVVFDGLDEVLVHLSAANGQQYTSQLLRLLDLPRNDKQPAPKMLLSCRSHFFKSLSEQRAMLMERGRSKLDAQQFEALLLLPFTDAQIEDYLKSALPNLDSAQAMATIRAVHNVSELAARPYLLREVARLLPRLEQWRFEGRKVQGVTVYREMVREWLMRDQGKHQIAPEHKLLVARDLAAELWARGSRMIDASALSSWYFRWRQKQADAQLRYSDIHPDKLDEDLRNSQFLVREDAEDEKYSGFRFAHSSMQEYFLAEYLLQALRDNAPERWAIKGPSVETLVFFGQLLTEHADENLLSTLSRWRAPYQKQVSELYLHYALMAYERNWPQPSLHGLDMRGAKLRRISFGQKPQAGQPRLALEYALFDGAALTDCRFHSVRLNGAQFVGADLSGASLIECAIEAASFDRADLSGTVFRRCVGLASTDNARQHRTQWVPPTASAVQANGAYSLSDVRRIAPARSALTALHGHLSAVTACQLSLDGTMALSASWDHTLRLWDTLSGETLCVFQGHSDIVTCCQLTLDGSTALSASHDNNLRLWDTASGETLRVLQGHSYSVEACQFSCDGSKVLSASFDNTMRLWDTASGKTLRVFHHSNSFTDCQLSPDSSKALSASADHTLQLWDITSGETLRVFKGHSNWVNACQLSRDGSKALSGSADHTLRLWDTASGETLCLFKGHSYEINACQLSYDGSKVLSASMDKTLRLWDAASGETLRVFHGHSNSVTDCQITPDGSKVLSASLDGTMRLWDTASGETLRIFQGHSNTLAACQLALDGSKVLSANWGVLRLWSTNLGESLRYFADQSSIVTAFQFSPDGSKVLSATRDNSLRLLDAASGETLCVFQGHTNSVTACQLSTDGSKALSASMDNTMRLWDTTSGETLRVLEGHSKWVLACQLSSDGKKALSASCDNTLRLWDTASGKSLLIFTGHSSRVNACQLSRDGSKALSGSQDHTMRLWDTVSGETLCVFQGHSDAVFACQLSSDSSKALSASADQTLRLWDTSSGETLQVFQGHTRSVTACQLFDNGTALSSSDDGTLRLWDVATGETLRVYLATDSGTACFDPRPIRDENDTTPRLIHATGEIWRHLAWQVPTADGGWERVPLETFGDVVRE